MADTQRTQTELLNIFRDGQTPNSITEQDMRDLIISLRKNQGDGWAFYVDNARFTEGNALSVVQDTRTKLQNDGANSLTQTAYIEDLGATIWNVSTNAINPEDKSSYLVRITFACKTSSAGSSNYVELDLDIGAGGIGTGPVIWKEIRPLVKGANLEHNFAYSIPVFALDPFPTNGGSFFINSNVPLDVWNFRIYIERTYKVQN
jgi:hypothetical protein